MSNNERDTHQKHALISFFQVTSVESELQNAKRIARDYDQSHLPRPTLFSSQGRSNLAPFGTPVRPLTWLNHRSPRSRRIRTARVVLGECQDFVALPSCVWALVCQTRRNVQKSCTAWGILVWTWTPRWRQLGFRLRNRRRLVSNNGFRYSSATAKRSTHGAISALISLFQVTSVESELQNAKRVA